MAAKTLCYAYTKTCLFSNFCCKKEFRSYFSTKIHQNMFDAAEEEYLIVRPTQRKKSGMHVPFFVVFPKYKILYFSLNIEVFVNK